MVDDAAVRDEVAAGPSTPRTRSGSVPAVALTAVVAAACGAAFGVAVKTLDGLGAAGAGDIGSYLGLWTVVTTVLAATAPSWTSAAVRATAFMGAAMTAYYAYQAHLFGYFPQRLWLAWLALSLVAVPVWAALVSRARGRGWWSAVAASAPVGLLLAEAWSQHHTLARHLALALFDGTAAAVLLVLLPRSARQRLRVAVLVLPAAVLATVVSTALWSVVGGQPF